MHDKERPRLPGIGQIGPIPTALIRPFGGQPRKHFDPVALQELADSIASEGQRTPAWVMPVKDDANHFELIAGERRLRACQIANVPTLLCEVRYPQNAADQYIDSVMENFGRKDCTALEAAYAVAEVVRIRFGNNTKYGDKAAEQVAKVFARSTVWVHQHLSLLRLHPDVLRMLEHPQRIPTAVAFSLANLRPEMQLSLANDIIGRKLRHKTALTLIRNAATSDHQVRKSGRTRRPSDDFDILARFLRGLGDQAEAILSMPAARLGAMFAHRAPKDLHNVRLVLSRRIAELAKLESALKEIGHERNHSNVR